LRTRRTIAITTILIGILLLAISGFTVITGQYAEDSWLTAAVGAVLLVIGLILFITDRLETLLSGGQTALVDGLQAG
jgi:uncharacterized membrane protein